MFVSLCGICFLPWVNTRNPVCSLASTCWSSVFWCLDLMRFVATISEIHLGSIFYFYAFILGASSKSAEGIKSYESNVSIDICKRLRDYNIDLLLPSKSIFCHYPVSCKLKKHWEMIAYVFRKYPKNFAFQLFIILQWFTRKICNFLIK